MVAIKSIGRVLKERRTELGFGLSEAESFTKIQKLYIVALETDDYKALPGEFYVRAYLKQYAEKLGLNADKIIEAYEEGLGITVEDDPSDDYHFVKPSDRPELEDEETGPRTWRYYVPIIALSAVALAIIGAVMMVVLFNRPESTNLLKTSYTYSKSSSKTAKATTSEQTSSSSSTSQNAEKLTVTGSGSLLTATLSNATRPVKIVFTAGTDAKVWVLVRNSNMDASGSGTGTTLDSTTPTLTATLDTAATQSTMTIGNHDNVTMTINGHAVDLSQLSNTGGPYTINLTVSQNATTTASSTTTNSSTSSSSTSTN